VACLHSGGAVGLPWRLPGAADHDTVERMGSWQWLKLFRPAGGQGTTLLKRYVAGDFHESRVGSLRFCFPECLHRSALDLSLLEDFDWRRVGLPRVRNDLVVAAGTRFDFEPSVARR